MADEQVKKVKLVNSGELYQGYDDGLKTFVTVGEGEEVEVSEAKAEQLKADFPENWGSKKASSTKKSTKAKK